MKRDIYVTEYLDEQRCREWAREKAREGDEVMIHHHPYEVSCWMRGHEKVSDDK
jgi:hypothetical protein